MLARHWCRTLWTIADTTLCQRLINPVRGEDVVASSLSSTLAIWRNMWSDSVDLAHHARKFIDDGLRSASDTQSED